MLQPLDLSDGFTQLQGAVLPCTSFFGSSRLHPPSPPTPQSTLLLAADGQRSLHSCSNILGMSEQCELALKEAFPQMGIDGSSSRRQCCCALKLQNAERLANCCMSAEAATLFFLPKLSRLFL